MIHKTYEFFTFRTKKPRNKQDSSKVYKSVFDIWVVEDGEMKSERT